MTWTGTGSYNSVSNSAIWTAVATNSSKSCIISSAVQRDPLRGMSSPGNHMSFVDLTASYSLLEKFAWEAKSPNIFWFHNCKVKHNYVDIKFFLVSTMFFRGLQIIIINLTHYTQKCVVLLILPSPDPSLLPLPGWSLSMKGFSLNIIESWSP